MEIGCTNHIWWFEIVLQAFWTRALELPLLLYWCLNLLISRLCIGSLKGTMLYKILSNEERSCIMGMRKGEMKSSNIAFVLNVPQSTVSTILTNWKF